MRDENEISNLHPKTPARAHSFRLDGASPSKHMSKIRSLGKLNLRSPLLTPGAADFSYRIEPDRAHTPSETIQNRPIAPATLYTLRNYYNDFTTIDWTKAFILANKFRFELKHNKLVSRTISDNHDDISDAFLPYYYKYYLILSKWMLIILIGFSFSLIAFIIDKFEILLVGFKHGYCKSNWLQSQVSCCILQSSGLLKEPLHMNIFRSGYVFHSNQNLSSNSCPNWVSWSGFFHKNSFGDVIRFDFIVYVILTSALACAACLVTLTTKISGKSEGAMANNMTDLKFGTINSNHEPKTEIMSLSPRVLYTAAGSGVPEVKTILSGYVIRRFLGLRTLIAKTISLILAIASGLVLGKEGPYVHLATVVGNVMTRFVSSIHNNELFRKQVLSASALAGVALAFGSPLGGVLFILEEINNYLPSHQLFQIFFCAISSTLFLKFLNPYGTGKTVLFELKYDSDWKYFELIFFVMIGIAGGLFGASFVRFVKFWPKTFRKLKVIDSHPIFEVFLISCLTGLVTFWNPYTKQASSELVLDLATSCNRNEMDISLCPKSPESYSKEILSLGTAFVIKVILTFITFGLKLPCGIYVPSMVAGALYGRIFALCIQWLKLTSGSDSWYAHFFLQYVCNTKANECVDLGIYSMIGAGAFMAGVTRMNITLVTILFELTSSYNYVLPISVSIAVANWAGGFLEKNSLYESLLEQNDYPFMSPETEPLDPLTTAAELIRESEVFETNPNSAQISRFHGIFYQETLSRIEGSCHSKKLCLDITESPYVVMSTLECKLLQLAERSLLDGCIPLVKNKVCVGLIYFSELEFCLDKLKELLLEYNITQDIYCKLLPDEKYSKQKLLCADHRAHNLKVVRNRFECDIDYFNYGSIKDHSAGDMKNFMKLLNEYSDFGSYIDYSPIFLNYDCEVSLAHLIFDKVGNRVIVLLKEGEYFGILDKKVLIDYCRRQA
ncbi:uncharacterized protein PRCAT00003584001 [Priceomyces carsonii]|uniref:uncharacterized protein n=1 Tax=Priceomyces carsonii TaxID=28549 RepID=UPI002EDBB79D|nr:unnamed protein product [Priceomyces carsonii]